MATRSSLSPGKGCNHYRAVKEMCDTEVQYVSNLYTLSEVFYKPLQVQKFKILNDGLVTVFFSNVSQILAVNSKFCEEICHRLDKWGDPSIPADVEPLGRIFNKFAPLLNLYCEYAGSFDDVTASIRNHEAADGPLKSFLAAASRDPRCGGRSLQSFLIMPIQRVPRYQLLLKELLKHLPQEHKSRQSLSAALVRAGKASKRIEREMHEREEIDKMLKLQRRFNRDSLLVLARPGRKLLKAQLLRRRGHRSEREVRVFLFSDLLVYADEAASGRLICRGEFSLHRCRADPAPLRTGDPEAPRTIQIRSPEYSFEVICNSEVDRDDWLNCLTVNIAAARAYLLPAALDQTTTGTLLPEPHAQLNHLPPKDEFAAVWNPNTSSCELCNRTFGVFLGSSRHHCRWCGRNVCGPCSPHRLYSSKESLSPFTSPRERSTSVGADEEGERVCNVCLKARKDSKNEHDKKISTRPIWGKTGHNPDKDEKHKPTGKEEKKNKRYLVALEIQETEITYVNLLKRLVGIVVNRLMYLNATATSSLGLPPHMHVFLVAARQILKLNTRLLATLGPRLRTWYHQQPLGDVFAQFGPLFKVYREYAENYAQVLQTIKTSTHFSRAVLACNRHLDDGLTAESLFILPIQRVPRYRLLLQQLILATPKFHRDFAPLERACAAVEEALSSINRAIKDKNAMEVMSRIQQQVAGDVMVALFRTGRWLLKEGDLQAVEGSQPAVKSSRRVSLGTRGLLGECRLYLFTDIIMFCRRWRTGDDSEGGKKPWVLHQCYSLRGVCAREANPEGVFVVRASKEIFLQTNSSKKAKEWVNSINEAVEDCNLSLKRSQLQTKRNPNSGKKDEKT
ncbi:hypothetical protein AAMO2058_000844900 [Amorphochlora amoebiformis]